MAAKVALSVEVQGDDIVVSLPGTGYVVTYYRARAFPQQLLKPVRILIPKAATGGRSLKVLARSNTRPATVSLALVAAWLL